MPREKTLRKCALREPLILPQAKVYGMANSCDSGRADEALHRLMGG